MNASERFDAARAALENGNYPEALSDLIWFHEHALAESPSCRGVRLSFALSAWARLATLYPPALSALRDTRARTAALLLGGEGDWNTFRDVVRIDETLKETGNTYALYIDMESAQPALALRCGELARDALIGAGDFARAAAVAPDFVASIATAAAGLHANLARLKTLPYSRAPTRWAFMNIYLTRVRQILLIARGLRQFARAAALERMAVASMRSPSVRRQIAQGLLRPLSAPRPERKRWRLQALRACRQETAQRRRARCTRNVPD